mmetsp:Transcript_55814/g.103284  ORF Transcript_55814/g.103284 Transcript_55814/m.103284 type:complete len:152 (-) Transcript_55814:159-614(-)
MVFFTILATLDSLFLLAAMSGLVGSSCFILKAIADLEYDIINSMDFLKSVKQWQMIENGFMLMNVIAVLPFLFNWWMCPPQLFFMVLKFLRYLVGMAKFDETKVFDKVYMTKHRKVAISSLFFYLISWFFYFARAVTAVMDIHIHGISPYD